MQQEVGEEEIPKLQSGQSLFSIPSDMVDEKELVDLPEEVDPLVEIDDIKKQNS